MSDLDDYQDEMRRFSKFSDRELDRMVAGEEGGDPLLGDLAGHLDAARHGLVQRPSAEARGRHLTAIAEEAGRLDVDTPEITPARIPVHPQRWRRVMRGSILVGARALAGAGVLAISTFGLAFAGVDLPGTAAERAFEAVGVDLPNQGSEDGKAVSDDVRAVITGSNEKGCEFGQAVSEAASQNGKRQGPENDPCAKDSEGNGEPQGGKSTGEEHSADGRARAAEKSGGRSDAGADNAGTHDDKGRETASEKSGGRSDAGPDNAGNDGGAGADTAGEKSGGASDAGPDNAGAGDDKGSGTAEESSGGGPSDVGP